MLACKRNSEKDAVTMLAEGGRPGFVQPVPGHQKGEMKGVSGYWRV